MNERRRSQSSEGHGVITVGSEGGGGGAEGGSRAREKHEAHRPRRRKLHTRGGGEGSSGPDLNLENNGARQWAIQQQQKK